MKNIVRAFVLALTVTGSAAYTQINNAPASAKATLTSHAGMLPIPCCEPDGSTTCGWGRR